jgi:hypothetical protein
MWSEQPFRNASVIEGCLAALRWLRRLPQDGRQQQQHCRVEHSSHGRLLRFSRWRFGDQRVFARRVFARAARASETVNDLTQKRGCHSFPWP